MLESQCHKDHKAGMVLGMAEARKTGDLSPETMTLG
jgi:hypothetical protein